MPKLIYGPPLQPQNGGSVRGRKGFPSLEQAATCPSTLLAREISFAGCSDYSNRTGRDDGADMQSLNPQFDLLGRLITATELRQKVIGNNIANIHTPNYKRMDVNFEAQLAQEIQGQAVGQASPEVVFTPGLIARADGNNVDIDREIGQMNKNAMLQQTYIQLLGNHLEQMRLAIEGS